MSESVGRLLRQARLDRGANLDQAAEETHVRAYYLQALEADDYGALPSTVQGKGFLRLYAGYLGLDPAPLLAGYGQAPAAGTPSPMVTESPFPADSRGPVPLPQPVENSTETAGDESGEDLPPEANAPLDLTGSRAPVIAPSLQAVPKAPPEAGWQEIFTQLGADLQQNREQLGLTLDEVERHTRLRVHYLRALEDGRMQDMPSYVQARGMLANYARFLDLDGEAYLLRFAEALQRRREELAAQEETGSRRPAAKAVTHPELRRFLSVDLLVGSSLIFILIGFVIWGSSRIMVLRGQKPTQGAPPSVADVLLATPSIAAEALESAQPAERASPAPTQSNIAQPEEQLTLVSTEPTLVPGMADGAVQVYVIAQQRAWMRVTVDGAVKFDGRVIPGTAYPYAGDKQIELLTGNGAGLQVFYDEKDLGLLGSEGQVVNLIFSASGMATPTASPTPKVTLTPTGARTATRTATATAKPTVKPTLP